MTKNSVICKLIYENPENWREKLETLSIKVKEEYPLAIFNYGLLADFTNPVVREARGIIIRLDTLDVAGWPYNKFCNPQEAGAQIDLKDFDWNNCHCQEKIDGSIVKLFFNPITDKWQWATNACINAKDATVSSCMEKSYLDVILKADNYKDIPFSDLNRDWTYIFELVSPQTQVVVKYPKEHLYHTGTRSNVTGEEFNIDIGIEKPKEYPLHSLADCIASAKALNENSENVTKEGFVVVDKNWHRVKVKSPDYLVMHHMSNNNNFSKERIIELIRNGEATTHQLAEDFPLYAVYFKYYDYKMAELEWNVSKFISYVRALYKEYNGERKAVALAIKDNRLAGFGFQALENEKSARQILDQLSNSQYCKLIPDYETEDTY